MGPLFFINNFRNKIREKTVRAKEKNLNSALSSFVIYMFFVYIEDIRDIKETFYWIASILSLGIGHKPIYSTTSLSLQNSHMFKYALCAWSHPQSALPSVGFACAVIIHANISRRIKQHRKQNPTCVFMDATTQVSFGLTINCATKVGAVFFSLSSVVFCSSFSSLGWSRAQTINFITNAN